MLKIYNSGKGTSKTYKRIGLVMVFRGMDINENDKRKDGSHHGRIREKSWKSCNRQCYII